MDFEKKTKVHLSTIQSLKEDLNNANDKQKRQQEKINQLEKEKDTLKVEFETKHEELLKNIDTLKKCVNE